MFVRIAYDERHAGQRGDFMGGALGVASGNDYFAGGIVAANAAEGGAGLLFGGSGDGTGI